MHHDFRLYVSINETSDTLEAIRANIDDRYKLIQLRSQEYQDIIAKYRETWQAYRVSNISRSSLVRGHRTLYFEIQ